MIVAQKKQRLEELQERFKGRTSEDKRYVKPIVLKTTPKEDEANRAWRLITWHYMKKIYLTAAANKKIIDQYWPEDENFPKDGLYIRHIMPRKLEIISL